MQVRGRLQSRPTSCSGCSVWAAAVARRPVFVQQRGSNCRRTCRHNPDHIDVRCAAAAGAHAAPAAAAQPPTGEPLDRKPRLAIFVSGGGSNFKAIHAACLRGDVNADVAVRTGHPPATPAAGAGGHNQSTICRRWSATCPAVEEYSMLSSMASSPSHTPYLRRAATRGLPWSSWCSS